MSWVCVSCALLVNSCIVAVDILLFNVSKIHHYGMLFVSQDIQYEDRHCTWCQVLCSLSAASQDHCSCCTFSEMHCHLLVALLLCKQMINMSEMRAVSATVNDIMMCVCTEGSRRCTVCLEDYNVGDIVTTLPCGH